MTTADYLSLPYTVEISRNEDGYFARVVELPGCMTWAEHLEDLWPLVEDAKLAWIEDALERGETVPEPADDGDAATRVIVHLPDRLRRNLVRRAEQEGMSLDQFVTTTLARAVGES